MTLASDVISLRLSDSALDELARCETREERGKKLLDFINEEIRKMDRWSEQQLGGPGAKFENAYLRTYLYRKITGELEGIGDIDDLPKLHLENAHPALGG